MLVALCLFAPSIWMLATIPPLWKDVDAYGQVTAPPNTTTILLFGPVYCFLARAPLYIGYAFECWRAGTSFPSFRFFVEPILSDSGVWLLVLSQHVAFCCAACIFIISATKLFLVRFAFALLWAASPLFYTWAHCVGTETLSLILLLLVSAAGLRIIAQPAKVPLRLWVSFGLLFTLSMLTRHINGILGALLPLTFGIVAVVRWIAAVRQTSPRKRRWLRYRGGQALRNAFIAVALGIVCIALSNVTLRLLSRAAGVRYHTTAGFTFMFRLSSLGPASPQQWEDLIENAAVTSRSADVRTLLSVFRTPPVESAKLNAMDLLMNARTLFPEPTADSPDIFDEVLNQTARAFLRSPHPVFRRAVLADFGRSLQSTVRNVATHPFRSTVFYFSHADSMPGLTPLATFQGTTAGDILGLVRAHPYLRRFRDITYAHILFASLLSLLLLAVLTRGRLPAVAAYALALTSVGLLMMFANCVLNEYQARYTLPMWQLTIAATLALLGSAANVLRLKVKSAGRLVRPG